jgi:hypothetical protein
VRTAISEPIRTSGRMRASDGRSQPPAALHADERGAHPELRDHRPHAEPARPQLNP